MLERRSQRLTYRVLFADDNLEKSNAQGRAARTLSEELTNSGAEMVPAPSPLDAYSQFKSDAGLLAVLVNWSMAGAKPDEGPEALIHHIRKLNAHIPIILLTDRTKSTELSEELLKNVTELVWLMEDSAPFIAGRIIAAMRTYGKSILGPMAKSLLEFNQVHEYSWHTPGHTGGVAFQKSPAGRIFYDYFGENMFRSDLSISVGELGSLLDHSGPIGEGERYAARVFGADRSYSVTNGTSTSNRVIWMACVTAGQKALVDRNCHKSSEQGLTLTGAEPRYLMPIRNKFGIIGPIPPEELQAAADEGAAHAVITNSTYDGLTYNVERVLEIMGGDIDRIHFDEAWYGYARFHPLYAGRFAMRGAPEESDREGPTIFATHSTHKLLAALSQASFIHMREGRNNIEHERFNESFMMHASTSPFYPIIASNDVTAAMMDGQGGEQMVDESIREAIAFRQTIMRLWHTHKERDDWFFQTWNPVDLPSATDPSVRVPFAEECPDRLANDPACWVLHPEDTWHGYDLEDDYCMLDPIKVSVLAPGMNADGSLNMDGFPASLLTSYLDGRGIVVEKTTDFTVLFLFSLGITNAKWSTLVHAMLAFKADFDANTPLADCIPSLAAKHPGLGLRDLAKTMMEILQKTQQIPAQDEAFSTLPTAAMTPQEAYKKLVANQVERIPVSEASGRIAATGIVPYPPGIPLVMPGEELGSEDSPFIRYLLALEEWDRLVPGFDHDTHGISVEEGRYYLQVLR